MVGHDKMVDTNVTAREIKELERRHERVGALGPCSRTMSMQDLVSRSGNTNSPLMKKFDTVDDMLRSNPRAMLRIPYMGRAKLRVIYDTLETMLDKQHEHAGPAARKVAKEGCHPDPHYAADMMALLSQSIVDAHDAEGTSEGGSPTSMVARYASLIMHEKWSEMRAEGGDVDQLDRLAMRIADLNEVQGLPRGERSGEGLFIPHRPTVSG